MSSSARPARRVPSVRRQQPGSDPGLLQQILGVSFLIRQVPRQSAQPGDVGQQRVQVRARHVSSALCQQMPMTRRYLRPITSNMRAALGHERPQGWYAPQAGILRPPRRPSDWPPWPRRRPGPDGLPVSSMAPATLLLRPARCRCSAPSGREQGSGIGPKPFAKPRESGEGYVHLRGLDPLENPGGHVATMRGLLLTPILLSADGPHAFGKLLEQVPIRRSLVLPLSDRALSAHAEPNLSSVTTCKPRR
jgi:hypothetical protein